MRSMKEINNEGSENKDTQDQIQGRPSRSHRKWNSFFGRDSAAADAPVVVADENKGMPTKWSMGVLNDRSTHEVPGSVLLLTGERNEPLGLRNAPARTSGSSLPSPFPIQRRSSHEGKKKTKDGAVILEPQPDDSHNDPLNWPAWRRDSALLSLGFYCMVGGGMTPILAAGFTNVASTYNVTVPQVALTTGLYMMGMGCGSVLFSPTAILYGKRPVYLFSCILFVGTSLWCAASPSYPSLVAARVFQGVAVSPVECLPSATIAEIFFLHERAYRIGVYTLLLLGGKNLVPLVSAVIIQSLSWQWVFWIVAMIVGFCGVLLFLFVPETFWDRTPRAKSRTNSGHRLSTMGLFSRSRQASMSASKPGNTNDGAADPPDLRRIATSNSARSVRPPLRRPTRDLHVGFASEGSMSSIDTVISTPERAQIPERSTSLQGPSDRERSRPVSGSGSTNSRPITPARHDLQHTVEPAGGAPPTPGLHNFNSPFYARIERTDSDYLARGRDSTEYQIDGGASHKPSGTIEDTDFTPATPQRYTTILKESPRRTFIQQLKPFEGRLHQDNWFRVAIRPFVLFAYPAVLWSAVVYSCSVGWLIVLSESVATIYRSPDTYNFSALSTGLIYLSPFIGGILGTAVAGKVSDIIVRAISKRNGGLYEPEFRLVMAIPVAITTVIGLMGFGWSAQVHDQWIVPTVFFGIISFGCSLGSTTAITFCVDSYRQYAGEALVTLNFSKNIFHGLVFSLFFNKWLEADGSRTVFLALGGIQLVLLLATVPMYVYGKRARMWTVRMNLMERF